MDTKKLYINSQKRFLTWALVVSGLLFLITIPSFSSKNLIISSYNLWISTVVYISVFVALLINRIYINKNAAFIAFLIYLSFSVYSIFDMIVKFKSSYALLQTLSQKQNPILSISITYTIAFIMLLSINFLYYKVYKATQNILLLDSSVREE